MPRICALVVIENTEEIKMHGTVHTRSDCSIQWGCAKLAISLTIIRYNNKLIINHIFIAQGLTSSEGRA
jgi:hypothetical protein